MITLERLNQAAYCLRNGGVVVIPTDTVYGIAAHPHHPQALARICTIKGRPTGKPIALLAASLDAVHAFGATVSPAAACLARAFWPGALTLVLPCGAGYEGFRIPDHAQTRELLTLCGGILRVTSANLSGAMPATTAVDALKDVGLEADLVLDDGISPGGVASTVVKIEPSNALTVIREGALSATLLHRALEQGRV